jgi:hypothetical protein
MASCNPYILYGYMTTTIKHAKKTHNKEKTFKLVIIEATVRLSRIAIDKNLIIF